MPKYKFVKRLLRNKFYSLILGLIELIPHKFNRTVLKKRNISQWEYVRAFVVLFPKVERYLIPQKKCLEYGSILGVNVKGLCGVSSASLRSNSNFNQIRSEVYQSVLAELNDNMDVTALLNFFYFAENPYLPYKYESDKYVIVGMYSTVTSSKVIYTPGQSHCIVIIFFINGKLLTLSHYSRKKIKEMMKDLYKSILSMSEIVKELECYILSDKIVEDASLVQKTLSPLLLIDIKYYGHYKPPEKSNHMTYNIKVVQHDQLVEIFHTAMLMVDHTTKMFSRMYAERGREFVPTEDFHSIYFTRIDSKELR